MNEPSSQSLTVIDVTISMVVLASAVSHVIFPVALVFGTIRPYLNTEAMSLPVFHLAFINCAFWENQVLFKL
jgi:hypothetical protein